MAFVLEGIFGLIEAAGVATVEATGSEAAGTLVSGTIKGAITTEATNKAIGTAEKATNYVFGDNFVANSKKNGSAIGNEVIKGQFLDQTNGLFGVNQVRSINTHPAHSHSVEEIKKDDESCKCDDSLNNTKKYEDYYENQGFQIPSSAGLNYVGVKIVDFGAQTDSYDYKYNPMGYNLSKIFNQNVFDNDRKSAVTDSTQKKSDTLIDNTKPSVTHVITNKQNKTITDPRKVGLDLGKLIGVHSVHMASNPDKSGNSLDKLKEVSTFHPELNYLIPKVLDYSSGIKLPVTQQFKDIYAKYNGRKLNLNSVTYTVGPDGLKLFKGVDELGAVKYYKETKGGTKIPAIQGVWTGPNSPNNALPINFLDLCSYFHDQSYHENGWFDLEADLIFISRLAQNLDRMAPDELIMAKFSINYFSTVGNTLATYKNSLSSKVANRVVQDKSMDDIFPLLVPEAVNDDSYTTMRFHFYNGVIDGLRQVELQSSPYSTMAVSGSNYALKEQLGNLLVSVD